MKQIVDAWIQHPTAEFIGHPMFATLRKWMGLTEIPPAIPIEFTKAALDASIDRLRDIGVTEFIAAMVPVDDEATGRTLEYLTSRL